MSRRDSLHKSARRTLEKDGWLITDDPLILVLEKTILKADLGAEKFFTADKEKTMGQMQLYQWALEDQEPDRQLFLAISENIYLKHFQKPIFQLVLDRKRINLLIYEPEQEVIIQWITH
jgi:XisH protein